MTPRSPIAWLLLLAAALALALLPHAHPVLASSAPLGTTVLQTPALENPDLACAACHQSIYDHYQRTPMARGSGLALDALQPGSLHHQPSGVDYRVFARDGAAWMSFSRPAPDTLSGERRLAYFIGSGQKGRTYLYQLEGQWFELPINFYTRSNAWDMAPAFDDAKTMPAVLPTDPNCLHCHATDVQPSLPTARNRYADAPFRQAGVGCSACHGDPSAHLAANGHGPILNPSKLSPIQRDSACLQCHLEGDTVVYRPGHSLARFRPGDNLFDSAVYFVRAGQQAGGARASSQYEALLRSACKRAAGDRLTCTTCHDPHSTPAPAERIAFFRARCLDCHTSPQMASHHPEQPDCAHCHMPTRNAADITHEQLTDHDIEAHPAPHTAKRNPTDELVPVGPAHPTDADYGLAYAQLAPHAGPIYQRRALDLLTGAPSLSPDAEVQLAYLRQLAGQPAPARAAYLEVLRQDPYQPTALANLGVLDAASGRLPETLLVLNRLLQADPSQTAAGLNLASIQCTLGHPAEARAILDRLRLFNPDDPQLRLFSAQGLYAGRHCDFGSVSH
jgi:tetratricopeptide (TPR) repeat protein